MRHAEKTLAVPASETRAAIFSADRVYRYTLDIVWDPTLPLCQFIGLNPSTADEVRDDPKVRRCKDFARRFGCGGLLMRNIFAFRATDPRVLLAHPAPIGEITAKARDSRIPRELNDIYLLDAAERSFISVAAWGNHGAHLDRGPAVARLIANLKCLGATQEGHPQHPLYLSRSCRLIPFVYPAG